MEGEEVTSSPFTFSESVYRWLDTALYYGITEAEFWFMTWAELERALEVKTKIRKEEERNRASFDYLLADSIGRSVARIYSSKNTFPEIEKVYPSLFTTEEVEELRQKQKIDLSVKRFKQFAQFHNNKFKEVGKTE